MEAAQPDPWGKDMGCKRGRSMGSKHRPLPEDLHEWAGEESSQRLEGEKTCMSKMLRCFMDGAEWAQDQGQLGMGQGGNESNILYSADAFFE